MTHRSFSFTTNSLVNSTNRFNGTSIILSAGDKLFNLCVPVLSTALTLVTPLEIKDGWTIQHGTNNNGNHTKKNPEVIKTNRYPFLFSHAFTYSAIHLTGKMSSRKKKKKKKHQKPRSNKFNFNLFFRSFFPRTPIEGHTKHATQFVCIQNVSLANISHLHGRRQTGEAAHYLPVSSKFHRVIR